MDGTCCTQKICIEMDFVFKGILKSVDDLQKIKNPSVGDFYIIDGMSHWWIGEQFESYPYFDPSGCLHVPFDEEIEEAADNCYYRHHAYARESFIEGVKWALEKVYVIP